MYFPLWKKNLTILIAQRKLRKLQASKVKLKNKEIYDQRKKYKPTACGKGKSCINREGLCTCPCGLWCALKLSMLTNKY